MAIVSVLVNANVPMAIPLSAAFVADTSPILMPPPATSKTALPSSRIETSVPPEYTVSGTGSVFFSKRPAVKRISAVAPTEKMLGNVPSAPLAISIEPVALS